MSEIDTRFFPTVEPLNNRYPCVFIPGLFSYRFFDFTVNPTYWGFNEDVQSIENNNNYIFTNIGSLESAHDSACKIFAQIYGGYADYGEEHSKKYNHDRYGKYFYPSKLNVWNSDRPVILVCHSHGAMTAQKLQYLLSIDFWKKGTDANWVACIISVNSAFNGSSLTYLGNMIQVNENGINIPPLFKPQITTATRTISIPLYFPNLIYLVKIIVLFVSYLIRFSGLGAYIISLIDPYDVINLRNIFADSVGTFDGKDNIIYELTYEGAIEFQKECTIQNPSTLYLNFMANTNITRYVPDIVYGSLLLSPFNFFLNLVTIPEKYQNKNLPYRYNWLNDGAVTMASQSYPYLNENNFINQALTLLDIHDQYTLLKFKKEETTIPDVVDTGKFYYIEIIGNDNNHLKYTLFGGNLPINDIFYRSIVDFIRQYLRRREYFVKKVLLDQLNATATELESTKFQIWTQTLNNTNTILNDTFGIKSCVCQLNTDIQTINTNVQIIDSNVVTIANGLGQSFSDLNDLINSSLTVLSNLINGNYSSLVDGLNQAFSSIGNILSFMVNDTQTKHTEIINSLTSIQNGLQQCCNGGGGGEGCDQNFLNQLGQLLNSNLSILQIAQIPGFVSSANNGIQELTSRLKDLFSSPALPPSEVNRINDFINNFNGIINSEISNVQQSRDFVLTGSTNLQNQIINTPNFDSQTLLNLYNQYNQIYQTLAFGIFISNDAGPGPEFEYKFYMRLGLSNIFTQLYYDAVNNIDNIYYDPNLTSNLQNIVNDIFNFSYFISQGQYEIYIPYASTLNIDIFAENKIIIYDQNDPFTFLTIQQYISNMITNLMTGYYSGAGIFEIFPTGDSYQNNILINYNLQGFRDALQIALYNIYYQLYNYLTDTNSVDYNPNLENEISVIVDKIFNNSINTSLGSPVIYIPASAPISGIDIFYDVTTLIYTSTDSNTYTLSEYTTIVITYYLTPYLQGLYIFDIDPNFYATNVLAVV